MQPDGIPHSSDYPFGHWEDLHSDFLCGSSLARRRIAKGMKTLTRQSISECERIVNQLHQRVHSTFASRDKNPKDRKAWQEATALWHAQRHPTDKLWSDQFMADLRASIPYAIEEAILFLEVDPW